MVLAKMKVHEHQGKRTYESSRRFKTPHEFLIIVNDQSLQSFSLATISQAGARSGTVGNSENSRKIRSPAENNKQRMSSLIA